MGRGRWLVYILIGILAVAGYGYTRRNRRALMWEYLFHPAEWSAEIPIDGDPILASPCGILAIRLDTVTLTGTGLLVRGRPIRDHFTDYRLEGVVLSLRDEERVRPLDPPPLRARAIPAEDADPHLQWHFPHAETGLEMGDEFHLALDSFQIAREVDRELRLSLDFLLEGTTEIPAGEDGYLESRGARLEDATLELDWLHHPTGRMAEAVACGLLFRIDLIGYRDDAGRPLGGSGTGGASPGSPWTSTQRLVPMAEGVEYLEIALVKTELSWEGDDPGPEATASLTLPLRIMR